MNLIGKMITALRTLVSDNRRRIHDRECRVNLDLTYITDRIIAMGYPAQNMEALFRNDARQVKKFLDRRHPGRYKVYNLCSDQSSRSRYSPTLFEGRMQCYAMPDHFPPKFEVIERFCKDMDDWFREDPENVAVVHCKAGKGRTGTMICCFLLYSHEFDDASFALTHFAQKRTMDGRGVTIPSQIRYIHYFDETLKRKLIYDEETLIKLTEISLTGLDINDFTGMIHFQISLRDICFSIKMDLAKSRVTEGCYSTLPRREIPLQGDVKLKVTAKRTLFAKKDLAIRTFSLDFHMCVNSFFLLTLAKNISDKGSFVAEFRASELDDFQVLGGKKDQFLLTLHFQT